MMGYIFLSLFALLVVFAAPVVLADDITPIPADKAEVEPWFKANVQPFSVRRGTLDPALEAAEASRRIITVNQNGGGDFRTINEAIKSIPTANKMREHDKTVFYGEYMCTGPGSHKAKRVAHTQEIDNKEANHFLSLGYIKGSKWLLPPPAF